MLNPALAYNLNEQVERHAYDTYDRFLDQNGDSLKQLPAPEVAKKYYETGDLYMFDEFHTLDNNNKAPAALPPRRRPHIETLYDVFVNVRDDEKEHYLTMEALQAHDEDVISTNEAHSNNNEPPL